jgi:hypothetical protein
VYKFLLFLSCSLQGLHLSPSNVCLSSPQMLPYYSLIGISFNKSLFKFFSIYLFGRRISWLRSLMSSEHHF